MVAAPSFVFFRRPCGPFALICCHYAWLAPTPIPRFILMLRFNASVLQSDSISGENVFARNSIIVFHFLQWQNFQQEESVHFPRFQFGCAKVNKISLSAPPEDRIYPLWANKTGRRQHLDSVSTSPDVGVSHSIPIRVFLAHLGCSQSQSASKSIVVVINFLSMQTRLLMSFLGSSEDHRCFPSPIP